MLLALAAGGRVLRGDPGPDHGAVPHGLAAGHPPRQQGAEPTALQRTHQLGHPGPAPPRAVEAAEIRGRPHLKQDADQRPAEAGTAAEGSRPRTHPNLDLALR